MARSMVSFGMFWPRALSTAVRKRGFPSMSPPPIRADSVSSLMSFVQVFDFLESEASFLCLILDQRLCPDMPPIIVTGPGPVSNFFGRFSGRIFHYGGPHPGVGGRGVWFQASGLSQAVWTSRWTALPFQLPAETETQPP